MHMCCVLQNKILLFWNKKINKWHHESNYFHSGPWGGVHTLLRKVIFDLTLIMSSTAHVHKMAKI